MFGAPATGEASAEEGARSAARRASRASGRATEERHTFSTCVFPFFWVVFFVFPPTNRDGGSLSLKLQLLESAPNSTFDWTLYTASHIIN